MLKKRLSLLIFMIFSYGLVCAQNFEFRRSEIQQKIEEEKKAEETTKEETAQESDSGAGVSGAESETPADLKGENEDEIAFERKKFSPDANFFVTFGPMLMINGDSTSRSAPSPVMYSGGIGWDFLAGKPADAQLRISFFTNYYLWDGTSAQPAEVENRTATGLSFMIDLCGGYTWTYGKNLFSAGGGLGILARFAVLSGGVDADEVNPATGTTASQDVSSISSDFYSNMNFLYPEITFTYSRMIFDGWKAAAEFRTYIPLGSLSQGKGFDSAIFSLSLKLNLPDE